MAPQPAAANQPPITSDETGGLGMGWIAKVMIALVIQALIGVAIYLYFDSQQDEESVQTAEQTTAPETPNTESAEAPATTATPAPVQAPKTIVTKVNTKPDDVDGPVRANETPARSQRKGIESGLTGALAIAETPKQKRERLKKLAEAKAQEAERARKLAEEAARQADGKAPAPTKPVTKPPVANADKKPKKPVANNDTVEKPKPQRPPDSYDGLMRAARKALKAGASGRAIAYLREAAKLNPRSVEPIAKMGWAYLRMNNTSQAIIKFSEAKAKNPGYRNTYVGLGKAFERAGRKSEAIGVYRQYLRICANCRRAESVRAALLRLGASY